jgi:hypothetical protein
MSNAHRNVSVNDWHCSTVGQGIVVQLTDPSLQVHALHPSGRNFAPSWYLCPA